jgi:hypothetical protein
MAGKSDEEEEDPEYLKVKEYVTLLEGHLLEAHRQSARLIKKQVCIHTLSCTSYTLLATDFLDVLESNRRWR